MAWNWRSTKAVAGALAVVALLVVTGCRPLPQPPANTAPGATAATAPTPATDPARVEALRRDIETLQLLGRMDLSPTQRADMLAAVEAALPAVQAREARVNRTAADLAAALEAKREVLLAGRPQPPAAETALRNLESRYQAASEPAPGDVTALYERLAKSLSRQQLRLLSGSLEARIRAGDVLDGYRRLPQDEFEAQVGGLAEELATESRDVTPDQLQALFTDARSLSDKEYREGREKLLDQLELLFLPDGDSMRAAIHDRLVSPGTVELLRRQTSPTR